MVIRGVDRGVVIRMVGGAGANGGTFQPHPWRPVEAHPWRLRLTASANEKDRKKIAN